MRGRVTTSKEGKGPVAKWQVRWDKPKIDTLLNTFVRRATSSLLNVYCTGHKPAECVLYRTQAC